MRVPLSWSVLSAVCLLSCASSGGSAGGRVDLRDPNPDVIYVAGVPFHTGTRVVTWREKGAYDAYLERCHFDREAILPRNPAAGCNTPKRYGRRGLEGLDPATRERVEARGFDLAALRERVDLFVLHYDVCGTSRRCFQVLHDLRGLSVHFLLDLDGTIYQTMDLSERGRHATIANDRSIGVEIAQMGAWPDLRVLREWYVPDGSGGVRIRLPLEGGDGGLRRPDLLLAPRRQDLFEGEINGRRVVQYDFTPQQYEALVHLTRALHRALPAIRIRVPRTPDGEVLRRALTSDEFRSFQGIVGHFHVQRNKVDPGPAFDWDLLLRAAREPVERP